MNNALQVITVLLAVMDLAERTGVNVQKFIAAREKAKAEDRDFTDEELGVFADDAQRALDEARDA